MGGWVSERRRGGKAEGGRGEGWFVGGRETDWVRRERGGGVGSL